MSERDGGPAFPVDDGSATRNFHNHPGMSLRDWFAGHALSGMLCNGFVPHGFSHPAASYQSYTAVAYMLADAMLAERKK